MNAVADANAIFERLRISKERDEKSSKVKGREVGSLWAKHMADYRELKRLADYFESTPAAQRDYEVCLPGIITLHTDDYFEEFWGDEFGDVAEEAIHDSSVVGGFVEGALEVWREFKDRLSETTVQ